MPAPAAAGRPASRQVGARQKFGGAAGPVRIEVGVGGQRQTARVNPLDSQQIRNAGERDQDRLARLQQREIILLSDVTGASFVRYGNRIEITVAYVGGDEDKYGGNQGEKLTKSFLLRTP